jgi:hypothetical protein
VAYPSRSPWLTSGIPRTRAKPRMCLGLRPRCAPRTGKPSLAPPLPWTGTRGWLVTCRHVVRDAVHQDPPECGAGLWLSFPQLPEGPDKHRRAQLKCLGDPHDVVLLKLEEPPLPPQVEVAVLGAAADSVGQAEDHPFGSFGYRRLSDYQGLSARGNHRRVCGSSRLRDLRGPIPAPGLRHERRRRFGPTAQLGGGGGGSDLGLRWRLARP